MASNKQPVKKNYYKDILVLSLVGIVLIEAYFIYSGRLIIGKYKNEMFVHEEALLHVMLEGGGFDYSNCSNYIMKDDPQVKALAAKLKTPQNAFNYVFHDIEYKSSVNEEFLFPIVIINNKVSNCVGQANLLVSLFRAMGVSEKDVFVIYGRIQKSNERGNHAWVRFHKDNEWFILDPTALTPNMGFYGYPLEKFHSDFSVVPVIKYNDTVREFIELTDID